MQWLDCPTTNCVTNHVSKGVIDNFLTSCSDCSGWQGRKLDVTPMALSCFVNYPFWSGRMHRKEFTPWEIPQESQNKLFPMPGHAHDDARDPAWQWSNEKRGPSSFKNYLHHVALSLLIFELLMCYDRSYIEWMYLVAWRHRPKVMCDSCRDLWMAQCFNEATHPILETAFGCLGVNMNIIFFTLTKRPGMTWVYPQHVQLGCPASQ